MSLISIQFFSFLLLVFITYFIIPKKYQWLVLLIASYLFYFFSGIKTFFFLLGSTIVIFLAGVVLDRVEKTYQLKSFPNSQDKEQKKQLKSKYQKQKRQILVIALLLVFGVLAAVKYLNFFVVNTNQIIQLIHVGQEIPLLNIILPLGISFYSFQSAGYLIDVYRGKISADKNFFKFALFVSFFPQLVQGPISRYSDLAGQLYTSHNFDYTRIKFGLQLMLWGIFKKLVIADRAAILVNTVFDNYQNFEGLTVFISAMFYCVQIYCDFSGGIDLIRGVAQIFGIDLVQNFARPFFATSIEDFWRRWHITLGSWMRDYVFYPLSLSRSFTKLGRMTRKWFGKQAGKMIPTFLAMMITFLLVGIWHGAQWKFVFYGLYNGFFISSGIILAPYFSQIQKIFKLNTKSFSWRFFQTLITFFLVSIGRYFSRAKDFMDAFEMLKQTIRSFNPWIFFDGSLYELGLDPSNFHLLLIFILLLLVVDLFQENGIKMREKIAEQNLIFRWGLYMILIFSIIMFGMYGIDYDAANFIYRGF